MHASELPFQLMMWIKRQQEEKLAHQAKMVKRNREEDKEWMRFISFIVRAWPHLNNKEKQMILNFSTRHEDSRNFSVKERGAITAMYLKYILEDEA